MDYYDPADVREAIRESEEYQKGREAYAKNKEACDNPYPPNTGPADWWDQGWWSAYEDNED